VEVTSAVSGLYQIFHHTKPSAPATTLASVIAEIRPNVPFRVRVIKPTNRAHSVSKGMVIGIAAPAPARVFSLDAPGIQFCEPPQGYGRPSGGLDVTDSERELSQSGRTAGISMPPKGSHDPFGRGTFRRNRAAVATLEMGQEDLHEGQAESAQKEHKKETQTAERAQDVAAWQDEVDLAHLPPDERVKVLRMLEPHHRMWDGRLGTVAATTHRVEVLPGSKPVRAQPYRAGSHARVAQKTEIDRMLAQQVIEPATCKWASPIVLVPKLDGTLQFFVDYRRLNMITVPDTYPLPRMDEGIDSLGDAVVFTTHTATVAIGKYRFTPVIVTKLRLPPTMAPTDFYGYLSDSETPRRPFKGQLTSSSLGSNRRRA
jgi:hypothetical protein